MLLLILCHYCCIFDFDLSFEGYALVFILLYCIFDHYILLSKSTAAMIKRNLRFFVEILPITRDRIIILPKNELEQL